MPAWNDPITWGQAVYLPAIIGGAIGLIALGWIWRYERKRRR